MRRLALVPIALTASLALGPPAWGAGNICSPPLPAGTDFFSSSEGSGTIMLPGFPAPLPFFVCGPTSISRGSPVDGPSPGQCTIPTEIVSMTLDGVFDPCGIGSPIHIIEDPSTMSTGQVVSNTLGGLPGTSFFDVYTLVDIPALAVFGAPHYVRVSAHAISLADAESLAHLPPGATTPGGPPCVEPGDDYYAAGYPDNHEHIPCPKHPICCQLECGRIIRVSDRTCQRFNGVPLAITQCPELCLGQPTGILRKSWGGLKIHYR